MKWPVIPAFLRNFYLAATVAFLVWMAFFDSNDFLTIYRQWRKLKDAEAERSYYQEKIQEVAREREEILGSDRKIEKYAREHYLMKRPGEDLYIIHEEELDD